ncbi:inositol 1,4,5-trisphosphate receptor-interacting protein isoform X2 [Parambassis ranga]|nr:inositol 1,4,5-trisphosphate receptor-interacting protein-like isoform X2 [Parambassis ranga]
MMQETLLRVFMVALGLLMCPRDDPGLEELDDFITARMQRHEGKLLREEAKLDQEASPVSEKTAHTDSEGPLDDRKNTGQHVTAVNKIPNLETTEDSEKGSADHKLPQGGVTAKSDPSEPETALKTSQISPELNTKDIQPDGSSTVPGERQENLVESSKEQKTPHSHIHTKTSENKTSKKSVVDWESDYLWYIWNMVSIVSTIHFFTKYLKRCYLLKQGGTFSAMCTAADVLLPDVSTLQHFYAKCVQVSSEKTRRKEEFLEGFANDLLQAMRIICDKNGDMLIEDFHILNECEIIVPLNPPEPYSFQYLLCNNQASDQLSEMQLCGVIKLVENKKIQNGCYCQSSDADEDMVCLLHCDSKNVKTKKIDACDGLLCSRSTPFLSKSQVTRWFQGTIKEAWMMISHKYEFELNICYIDAPGALVIRFRSGKKINFSMKPVVKFNNKAHFFITPWPSKDLDTFWTLSLTTYEDHLLEHLSKSLPENSCHIQTLRIAHFLHRRQAALSASSVLKDFHYKTALIHLLLTKDSSQWKPDDVVCRLRDLLDFMESSLERKLLNHILIGNPLSGVIELPAELIKAKPVNLFHPLVVHDCIYREAVMHFQEMLKNADMLIQEYVAN